MKTNFLIIGFILLLACSGSDKKKEGIIPEEKMARLLIDAYLVEGQVSGAKLRRDSALVLFEYGMQQIYEKHGIPDSVYRASMAYYLQHPEELSSVFETVLDSLNWKKQQLEPDSISQDKPDKPNKPIKEVKQK